MIPLAILSVLIALLSTGVQCDHSSASSSSSANSDGTGHTYTHTNNNGQGTVSYAQRFGGGGYTGQAYGLGNYGQPGGLGFGTYGAGYPYGSYGLNAPQYTPFPQHNYGFAAPYQPLPYQPLQPYVPYQSLATPNEFNQYLNSIQQQYAAGGSVAQSTPGATAFASSYLGPTKYYKQQQEYLNAWKNSPFQAGYGGMPNYAYATGAYSPNLGFHQTAGIFPPNKGIPNVDTRFDGDKNAEGNLPPSGFVGIQTSSFSSTSDINGVKKHKEGGVTTINDNGKVTTYRVGN